MRDFSKKYRGVPHFGIWAEETADQYGDRDAWRILWDGVRRCTTDDISIDPLIMDAVDWFEHKADRRRPHQDFRDAMSIVDPMQRYYALQDALTRVGQQAAIGRHLIETHGRAK